MRTMLTFGDSHVAAADRGRPGFSRIASLLQGLKPAHMGRGGTGFVKDSGERKPYPDRLADLLSREADVVVVQVSGNDAPCDLDAVAETSRAFLAEVSGAFPATVVLGPMWAIEGRERLPELRDRLAGVAGDLGLPYIDALDWLTPRWIGPDGAHFTRAGHLYVGWRLAHSMRGVRRR